jgi:hypothetical protein
LLLKSLSDVSRLAIITYGYLPNCKLQVPVQGGWVAAVMRRKENSPGG